METVVRINLGAIGLDLGMPCLLKIAVDISLLLNLLLLRWGGTTNLTHVSVGAVVTHKTIVGWSRASKRVTHGRWAAGMGYLVCAVEPIRGGWGIAVAPPHVSERCGGRCLGWSLEARLARGGTGSRFLEWIVARMMEVAWRSMGIGFKRCSRGFGDGFEALTMYACLVVTRFRD